MGQPALEHFATDDPFGPADDVILPAQFFSLLGDPRCEPEKRLMVAVLEEAIASLLSGQHGARDDRQTSARDAERWFSSEDRRTPFAFATICDILELDIGRVRTALAGWVERRRTFQRPRLQAGRGRHQVQRTGRRSRRAA